MKTWPRNCALAITIVFLSGVVVGWGICAMLSDDTDHIMQGPRKTSLEWAVYLADFYDEMLDLDDTQYEIIKTRLHTYVEDMRAVREPIRAQMHEISDRMVEDLKPTLSRSQYEKMKSHLQSRRGKPDEERKPPPVPAENSETEKTPAGQ